jgi:UDPglucose 6-dehydrogenase
LRAGSAVADFKFPDRVVLGTENASARERLLSLYRSLGVAEERILTTTRRSAELIKYAANGLLATKIAFVNEIAELSEKVDARIEDVARGIGLDRRIGLDCLRPGPGFGGSCFPKDARALAKMGEDHDAPLRIIETVLTVNEMRKRAMARKVTAAAGTLRGKTVALLGLTFKAGTDDMREAPSIPLAQALLDQGAIVQAFDPEGMANARAVLPDAIHYCQSAEAAVRGAHVAVLVTEWDQFLTLDFRRLRQLMRSPVIVDLRNLLKDAGLGELGFHYVQVGRRAGVPDRLTALAGDLRSRNRSKPLQGHRKTLRSAAERRKLVAAE